MRIRLHGVADEFEGKFLVEYDPSRLGVSPAGHELNAHLLVTDDPAQALNFSDLITAMKYVRQSYGMRVDGEPNRPLTAFDLEFI